MKTLSYSEASARCAEVLDAVVNDREEVVITRMGHESVVISRLDDYQALEEIAYLLRSRENAGSLITAIEELESGGGRGTNSANELPSARQQSLRSAPPRAGTTAASEGRGGSRVTAC